MITRLIHGLADLYLKDQSNLFPYPETMIGEGQTNPGPDILRYDHKLEKTMVLIEITHTAGVKKDSEKVRSLMNDYDIVGGFVYDYKKQIWYKISKANNVSENPFFLQPY